MRLMPALILGLMVTVSGAAMVAEPAVAAKKDKQDASGGAPQLKPSAGFVTAYQEADKAIKANDMATAQTKIAAAEKAATNDDDKYLLGSLKLNMAITAKDQPGQRAALEQILASGKTSPADTAKFSFFVGQFSLQDKDYDGAIQRLTTSVNSGYPGADAEVMLAEAYFGKATSGTNVVNNQLTPAGKQITIEGLTHLKNAIEKQKASGQPVDPSWTSRGFRMAALSGAPDQTYWSAGALKAGGTGAAENWHIVLRTFQDNHKTMTRDENLDVLRLMIATGSMTDAYSYQEYADSALKGGLFGEVKSGIEQGRSSGRLQPTQLQDVYQVASNGIAQDRSSLPASEASAAKAANGKIAVSTGNAYLGYGDNAKAIAMYRLALQKGGVSADEVNTRLGIALAKSGDTAGAKAAFATVTTPGARKEIADLWTTWLDSKAG